MPGLFLYGTANGILNTTLGRQTVNSEPADRAAIGSGANMRSIEVLLCTIGFWR
jgi:hypothetical protein